MTSKKLLRALSLAGLLILAVAAVPTTYAQQPPAAPEGFVPVDQLGEPKEELPATPLVAAAYGIAWAAVFVYVWSIWSRLRKVDKELADVARRLESGARR
jgi:CcmD family protein